MKNWKKASIGALCVVSLLAGCGTQGGDTNNNDKNADEPKEISLEQVRADNIPEKLLEESRHGDREHSGHRPGRQRDLHRQGAVHAR